MKNGFKRIIVLVIIIGGAWYMIKYICPKLKNINFMRSKFYLSELYKCAGENSNKDVVNTNENKELILVNRKYGLNKNYKPENLTMPNIPFVYGVNQEEKYVAEILVKPLEDLVNTAKKEGIILLGNSCYRSYKSQENVYDKRERSEGKRLTDAYVAKPGYSEHQTGLCIDIANESRNFIKGTKEADWLEKNCYRFGFIIRYPYDKKNITGIEYEPWHIRYVGNEVAKYIYDNKITLEEYLGK